MSLLKVENTIIGELYEIQSIDYNYHRFVSDKGDFPTTHMTDLGSLFNDSYYQLRNLTIGMRSHYDRARLGPIVMTPLTPEERTARRGDSHEMLKLRYSTTVESEGEAIPDGTSLNVLTIDHRYIRIADHKWSVAGIINALEPLAVYTAHTTLTEILAGDQYGRVDSLLTAYVVSVYCDRAYDYGYIAHMVEKMKIVLRMVAEHFPEGLVNPARPVGIRHMLEGGRMSVIVGY